MTLPFPIAQAATGLSSLAVFAWAAWFFVAVGAVALLAGLVVIARFIRWKLIADQPQVDVRGKVVPFVLSTTSVLGAPVFLFAFALDDPQTRWIFSVLFYAVLLALTVLVLTRSWKLALIVVGITIPAYLVRLSGTVALTEYVVIDSLPFEPSHLVAERYSSQFLRTDDGGLFRFERASLPQNSVLPVGSKLLVTPAPGQSTADIHQLRAIIRSNDLRRFQRNVGNVAITIPLHRIEIERYVDLNLGRAQRINERAWQARDQQLLHAITEGCCDVDWLRTLIEHGAQPTNVRVGERNLLHVLADNISRAEGIVEFGAEIIGAGVKVNARQKQGFTPLYVAIDSISGQQSGEKQMVERYVAFTRLLLEAGADPNIASHYDTTPLHRAVVRRQYEVAELLLQFGADPHIANLNGKTAYSQAMGAFKRSEDEQQRARIQALIRLMERNSDQASTTAGLI